VNRTVAQWLLVALQSVIGVIAGALSWTGGLSPLFPTFGHWFANALVVVPLLAAALAGFIHAKARRFAVFGWSFFVGGTVYGYLFTFLVLIHI